MEELEYNIYDPNMPCNKNRCDEWKRLNCHGCTEQLAWERDQKRKKNREKQKG